MPTVTRTCKQVPADGLTTLHHTTCFYGFFNLKNAIFAPENAFFPSFSGFSLFQLLGIRVNVKMKENSGFSHRVETVLALNTGGSDHAGSDYFNNHAGKLPKDDPSVVAKK